MDYPALLRDLHWMVQVYTETHTTPQTLCAFAHVAVGVEGALPDQKYWMLSIHIQIT